MSDFQLSFMQNKTLRCYARGRRSRTFDVNRRGLNFMIFSCVFICFVLSKQRCRDSVFLKRLVGFEHKLVFVWIGTRLFIMRVTIDNTRC